MAYTISQIIIKDIPDIVKFFKRNYPDEPEHLKNFEELNWLFSDPANEEHYNGFIARNKTNEVAGVIGYTINNYQCRDTIYSGVIPMSWLVSPSDRGILGVQLLLKVMNLADFGFAIHGSEDAIQTYQAVRLKNVAKAHVYTKVFHLKNYLKSENLFSIKTWIKALFYYGNKRSYSFNPELTLAPYKGEPTARQYPSNDLAIYTTNERTKWLEKCPVVESEVYSLMDDDTVIGTCICYVERHYHGQPRGRIVHIPYMAQQYKAYRQTISMLEAKLIDMGCCSITILASQTNIRKALKMQGYRFIDITQGTLIFIKDPKKLFIDHPFSEWYLTYYESDKGYRGI